MRTDTIGKVATSIRLSKENSKKLSTNLRDISLRLFLETIGRDSDILKRLSLLTHNEKNKELVNGEVGGKTISRHVELKSDSLATLREADINLRVLLTCMAIDEMFTTHLMLSLGLVKKSRRKINILKQFEKIK